MGFGARCIAPVAIALSLGVTLCLLGVTGQWAAVDDRGQPPPPRISSKEVVLRLGKQLFARGM